LEFLKFGRRGQPQRDTGVGGDAFQGDTLLGRQRLGAA
jgi:hypothetical protein